MGRPINAAQQGHVPNAKHELTVLHVRSTACREPERLSVWRASCKALWPTIPSYNKFNNSNAIGARPTSEHDLKLHEFEKQQDLRNHTEVLTHRGLTSLSNGPFYLERGRACSELDLQYYHGARRLVEIHSSRIPAYCGLRSELLVHNLEL